MQIVSHKMRKHEAKVTWQRSKEHTAWMVVNKERIAQTVHFTSTS